MLHHITSGSGSPVLLLPGMLGTIESQWQRVIPSIVEMGHSVIAADLPGHGKSELTKSLTVRVIVEEIDHLLSGIHAEPAVILGYDLGGYAALTFALKHPQRVLGLWMHATKFYWSGAEADGVAADLDLAVLEETKPEWLEALREQHTPEKLEAILPWLSKTITNMPDSGLTQMELEDLEVPIMISVGDRDELIPVSEAVDLYHALQRSQLSVFPDTFHPLESLRDHVFLPVFKDFLNRLD